MAYTTINKSTDYFNTKLYTGTGSSNSVTGVGFQPDFTWIKNRDQEDEHNIYDAVRGATKRIIPNDNTAEGTQSNGLSAFGSDGFTVVDSNATNINNENYASWNWKANGQGSSNTAGSINTTYTSVNTTSGISISKFTGTGSVATVGHGLNAVPKMIIVKCLDTEEAWTVYHAKNTSEPQTERLYLNSTDATSDSASSWNDTAPTSTVFTVGASSETNKSGSPMIAYCFAEKSGYSSMGQYTGNGNANGTFVYTGMRPTFLMVKRTNGTNSWYIYDAIRDGQNRGTGQTGGNRSIRPNTNEAEEQASGYAMDILSNGFKWRTTSNQQNGSGDTYIYMVIGQSLVGTNNVPCTAR